MLQKKAIQSDIAATDAAMPQSSPHITAAKGSNSIRQCCNRCRNHHRILLLQKEAIQFDNAALDYITECVSACTARGAGKEGRDVEEKKRNQKKQGEDAKLTFRETHCFENPHENHPTE